MAKQIKVIKCPHCGNTKPQSIGTDHYRCDKCGTEFFLDNDDININVKHSYQNNESHRPIQRKTIAFIIIGVFSFLFFVFMLQLCTSTVKQITKPRKVYATAVNEIKEWVDVQLLTTQDKPIVFYLQSRNKHQADKENEGIYAVFYDFINDKIISEKRVSENNYSQIEHRFFYSDGKHYYIINNRSLWEVDAVKCEIKDVSSAISQAKPALNSGFSTIRFVESQKGDGLILTTNLGKAFYYFPTIDQLYTYNAFNHISSQGMDFVAEDAKLRTIYLFHNKESKASSNVAQLMQITYKYNNGGPENQMTQLTDWYVKNKAAYRVVSIEPVTEDRISFFPEVVYSDSTEIVITYRPTLAKEAPQEVELLTTQGSTVWKVSFPKEMKCKSVIKTDSTYYLQMNEDLIFAVQRDGNKKEYKLQ